MNIESSTILVTGGAGFIGSCVTERLLSKGAEVHVADNLFTGKEKLVPDGATFHEIDIRDPELNSRVQKINPNIIIHLVAIHYIPYCNENPKEAFEVNVMGTRNLLEAARELNQIEKVVFASSAAVYPPREESNAEDSTLGPMGIYGETKLIGEDLMKMYSQETGVSTVSARLFNVYGPNETNSHLIPAVVEPVQEGVRTIELGNLTPKRDFVHVTDVARALLTLVEGYEGEYRAYNVGTGEEHSVKEVVEKTSKAIDEDIEIEQDPERVRESDRSHLRADISRIQTELGWSPTVSFVDGLRKLLDQEVIA
ncbi:NAD-dependent epimerase/dehydratase family protein [Halorubrum sp. SS5]|nr:NAD-dependent epimerase/dehydratase family protein [Halorubrum sp. SS5]